MIARILYPALRIAFDTFEVQDACFSGNPGADAKSSPILKNNKDQPKVRRLGINQNSPLTHLSWKKLSNIIKKLKQAQRITIKRNRFKIVAILLKRSIMMPLGSSSRLKLKTGNLLHLNFIKITRN